ncbi:oxygenase MpaB family protein [Streptacidiphilus sp. EB103A]|uniref:oxygenase MpaB family protein n=1 Tax=Streptacidiphilus sp. EB103A TaxID=3156275 RepID=UPI0035148287
MGRYDRLRYIRTLDPVKDCAEIFSLVTRYEFPWDYHLAFKIAGMTDMTMPSISGLLVHTGQFATAGDKRVDDSVLFEYEAKRAGLDSAQGHRAVRALNKVHGRYDISNDDYLFVLASWTTGPIRWINQYGWRKLTDIEVQAMVETDRRLGQLMGVKGVPETYQDFLALLDDGLTHRAQYAQANRAMADTLIGIVQSWFPRFTRPLLRTAIIALVEPPVRRLVGLNDPPEWFTIWVRRALRARGRLVRLLPARPHARPYRHRPRSYPLGWTIEDLGPQHLPEGAE